MPSYGQILFSNAPGIYRTARRAYDARRRAKAASVLSAGTSKPNLAASTAQFESLAKQYAGLQFDPYRSNPYENWQRALTRVDWLIRNLPTMQTAGRSVVEVGAGDGMVGRLLADYGHNVTLSDFEDWRDPRAKHLPLLQGPLENGIDLPEKSIDLAVSYNAFEHFDDPAACAKRLYKLVRPGGLMHFDFGPLFCAPFGMHCHTGLPVPYCQFLFPEERILEHIRSRGHNDLGRTMTELQPMNRWRLAQFDAAWTGCGCKVLTREVFHETTHLDLVWRFPEAFSGRDLCVNDLTGARVRVTLQRPEAG